MGALAAIAADREVAPRTPTSAQSWRTFLVSHRARIWVADFFTVQLYPLVARHVARCPAAVGTVGRLTKRPIDEVAPTGHAALAQPPCAEHALPVERVQRRPNGGREDAGSRPGRDPARAPGHAAGICLWRRPSCCSWPASATSRAGS